ncbi:hypothetical protein FISHEDRAFT_44526, partial [Fistulina hepatica ATCC 64428]
RYRQAVDEVERLVVQRLLELTKLNMSGVGYKQREKIRKALQARSQAIRKALDRYNEAARSLGHSREALTWVNVVEMVQLGEFELLRESRGNIQSADWSKPAYREATSLYFSVKRAREEVVRCNVEIT